MRSGLSYNSSGNRDGVSVIFLHGFLGQGDDWSVVTDLLSSEFHCLCLDLPGHGNSIFSKELHTSFDNYAESVIWLMDGFNIDKCNLVGYSMGARIALYLSLKYPDRFLKVVLESGSPGLSLEKDRNERIRKDNIWAGKFRNNNIIDVIREWYNQPIFNSLQGSIVLEKLVKKRSKVSDEVLEDVMNVVGTGVQPDLWPLLQELDVPTLAVSGCLDKKFCGISGEMELKSDQINAVQIPDAGHIPHLENHRDFIKSLEEFLTK